MRVNKLVKKFIVSIALLAPMASYAEEMITETASGGNGSGLMALAAAIAIGLAALGGTLGQGKAASAGLEGFARNPQANPMGLMIIGLALIESLVLFAFAIAFILTTKF